MSEVASAQADHAIYSYFTLRISSKWETCPYIHQSVAFTEGGQKSTYRPFLSELP